MRLLFGLICIFSLTSCFAANIATPNGILFNKASIGHSGSASSNDYRTGEACATSYLGWVATGDASIEAAASRSNITRIYNVSHEVTGILGVTQEMCTIVRGN